MLKMPLKYEELFPRWSPFVRLRRDIYQGQGSPVVGRVKRVIIAWIITYIIAPCVENVTSGWIDRTDEYIIVQLGTLYATKSQTILKSRDLK